MSALRVTEPNQRARVYVININIKREDTWHMRLDKSTLTPGRPHLPKTDRKKRRPGEKHIFDTLRIQAIGGSRQIEVAKLQGSDLPWYSPVQLTKVDNVSGAK
eukprot:UN03520